MVSHVLLEYKNCIPSDGGIGAKVRLQLSGGQARGVS